MTWKKGPKTLQSGDKYVLRQDGAVCGLQIHGLTMADAGEYSCVCGQEKTSATLTVRGKDHVCSCVRVSLCVGGSVPEHLPPAFPDFSISHLIPLTNVSHTCMGPTLDARKQWKIGCFLTSRMSWLE